MANNKSNIKCLYHQIKPNTPCPDGIAAAWVVKKKYPQAKLIGCSYQEEIPKVDDRDLLIIVDFSFSLDVLKQWEDRGCEIILIDHHKTLADKIYSKVKEVLIPELVEYTNLLRRKEELASKVLVPSSRLENHKYLPLQETLSTGSELLTSFLAFLKFTNLIHLITQPINTVSTELEAIIDKFCDAMGVNVLGKLVTKTDITFNINKCGALLTWEYLFPDEPAPDFLYLIQDRDLWKWKIANSREINTAFSYIGRTMDSMDTWSKYTLEELNYHYYDLGSMLYEAKVKKAKNAANKAHYVECWGYRFIAVGFNKDEERFYSDILEYLYTTNTDVSFVCGYSKKDNTYKLSFRSPQADGSFDCAKLAQSLGGGGHHNAAGVMLDCLPWGDRSNG